MKQTSFLTILFILLSSFYSSAQEGKNGFGNLSENSKQPIEAISDEMVVDNDKSEAEMTGNVEITQGEIYLYADLVRVIYDEYQSNIKKLFAQHNVVLVSGNDKASADEADYDIDRGTIIMTGNASIKQAGNTALAERAEIDIDSGATTLSGRVRTILQPAED